MNVTNITIGRTLSDGDYGSKKLEISGEIESTANEFEVAAKKMAEIEAFLTKGTIPKTEVKTPKSKMEDPKPLGNTKKEEVEVKKDTPAKKKAAKKVAKKTTKKVKSTTVPYNRELKTHKALFSSKVLDVIDPNWKGNSKAAIETSAKMEAEPMFVSKDDMTIVPSFLEDSEKVYLMLRKKYLP